MSNGDSGHEVDAVVPPETSQFDNAAAQQATKELTGAHKALIVQLNRYKNLAQALLSTPNTAGMMLADTYVHKALARAELVVISLLFEERLGISPQDFIAKVAKQLEEMLVLEEMEHKVLITEEGVFNA